MTFFDNVELWAKGYHRRIIGLELTPENYSSNFNWVKNWILIHFFYKINEFLIILLLLLDTLVAVLIAFVLIILALALTLSLSLLLVVVLLKN
jgi:hypothetical protein